jgi:acetyl esterase/lipase
VDVTHRQVPEMMHVWHIFAGRVPESTEAVEDIGAFAHRRFAPGAPHSLREVAGSIDALAERS